MMKHWTLSLISFIVVAVALDIQSGSAQTAQDSVSSASRPFVSGGIYDKPFITRLGGKTTIGGYGDFQFRAEREGGITEEVAFTLHRFNLFTYSVVTDRVRLGSEIEFENGGEEIKLEYVVVDLEVREELNVRAGIILSPLGKFNLTHDAPQNELTDRPLVTTEIIPSTLSEAGIGFWGAFYPSLSTRLTYELYAVNGFNEGVISNAVTSIKDGRGSLEEDNNNVPAAVGRVAISPSRGLEFGGSFHAGQYNVSSRDGLPVENRQYLSIFGADLEYRRGAFSLQGEYAHAHVDLPRQLKGFLASDQQGVYAQVGYRFLTRLSPVLPNSSLTGIVRFDAVDFDTAVKGDGQQRVTVGLNFRPAEDTALKLEYQYRRTADGVNNITPGRAVLFSVATYF